MTPTSTPVPAASALGRGPAGFVGNTGSLGEALYRAETALKPLILFLTVTCSCILYLLFLNLIVRFAQDQIHSSEILSFFFILEIALAHFGDMAWPAVTQPSTFAPEIIHATCMSYVP